MKRIRPDRREEVLLGDDAELKLYYFRARYYSPDTGRFINRDPIDIADDVNLCAYVGNNSIMYIDSTGEIKEFIINSITNIIELLLEINNNIDYTPLDNFGNSLIGVGGGAVVVGGTMCAGSLVIGITTAGTSVILGCSSGGTIAWAGAEAMKLGIVLKIISNDLSSLQSGGGGNGNGGKGYNYNQDKQLTDGEIKKLKDSGIDIHDLKPNSKFDLFKTNNGDIYFKRKTGRGTSEPTFTGLNINNF